MQKGEIMKINFTKNIDPLVKKFEKTAIEVGKDMRYTIQDAHTARDIFTRNCNSCSAVALNAGENTFLAHIDPKYFNIRTFANQLKKHLEQFQKKFGDAQAIIIGGWEKDRLDPFVSTPSLDVYSTIANVLDEIPLSMICGKKNNVTPYDNLFATENKITLASDTFESLGITSDKIKLSAEEIEKQLNKAYEWVEIDPNMLHT